MPCVCLEFTCLCLRVTATLSFPGPGGALYFFKCVSPSSFLPASFHLIVYTIIRWLLPSSCHFFLGYVPDFFLFFSTVFFTLPLLFVPRILRFMALWHTLIFFWVLYWETTSDNHRDNVAVKYTVTLSYCY